MATKQDYYQVLGVDRKAGADEIKKAYRKQALQYHPDRNPGDKEAERKFKEAAEAYQILSDPEKRARYDQYGHQGLGPGATRGFSSFEDIFEAFGDIFGGGGLFDGLFGGMGRRRGARGARPGRDVNVAVDLNLEDVARGAEKTVEVRRLEPCGDCSGTGLRPGTAAVTCPYCRGLGQVSQTQGFFSIRTTCPKCQGRGQVIETPCSRCQGRGRQPVKREFTVKIPAGVDEGQRVRVAHEGEVGEDGKTRGDLFCVIRLKEHPFFQRRGNDILCQVPISFTQAALGGEVEIPTLDGRTTLLKIPRATQSGQVLRLRQQGLPDIRGRKGDELVQVEIETPRSLSRRQEELLRELAATEDRNVSPRRKNFFDKLKEYFT